ncbi:MAG TPA: aldehyde dehydrogenase family protein, partial [Hyphomicrobiaceae bacterium]|nr:aldehyde dehydrogenase family protein [Hyphomicrobiaceae bacterium]
MTGFDDTTLEQMRSRFERLRSASRRDLYPPPSVRLDRLNRLKSMVLGAQDEICGAISADFGHRSRHETRLAEIAALEASIKHALRHVRSWMRPDRMPTRIVYWPGRNRLMAQPLGVCGIIAPWNYPLQLALSPAAGAIAAGNVVMLKPSEATPRFSALLANLVERT